MTSISDRPTQISKPPSWILIEDSRYRNRVGEMGNRGCGAISITSSWNGFFAHLTKTSFLERRLYCWGFDPWS